MLHMDGWLSNYYSLRFLLFASSVFASETIRHLDMKEPPSLSATANDMAVHLLPGFQRVKIPDGAVHK